MPDSQLKRAKALQNAVKNVMVVISNYYNLDLKELIEFYNLLAKIPNSMISIYLTGNL